MKNWSDSEVNERLLDFINPKWREKAEMHLAKNNAFYPTGVSVSYTVNMPDYCNSWADMGPLLLTMLNDGVKIEITENSINGEPLNGKSITRKLAELFISSRTN